ncbi:MAG: LysR family transcriptional regulator [Desulfobacteraceae bacterium]|nr:MAG: LysR family transcriptional regulator [Desulfobacteraceae bacterium]
MKRLESGKSAKNRQPGKEPSAARPASIDFDLRQLEIFSRVVELESFSKAADAVFLAQASVSERVAILEEMVGARLLDRMGRRVVPTKAGELLYKHALTLLKMKRTAVMEMQDFLGMKAGEVEIGCSTIPGEYILPGVIGRFCREHPLVKVNQTIAASAEIESRVLEGLLELGVIGARTANGFLESHELWMDELLLAIPANHRWASRKDVSLEELSQEPYVSRAAGSGTLRIIEEHLLSRGRKGIESLNVIARFGTSTAVKEAVKSGLGLSLLSSRAIGTEIKAGILIGLKLENLPLLRRFWLIRDNRRSMSPLCDRLMLFLKSAAEEDGRAPSG